MRKGQWKEDPDETYTGSKGTGQCVFHNGEGSMIWFLSQRKFALVTVAGPNTGTGVTYPSRTGFGILGSNSGRFYRDNRRHHARRREAEREASPMVAPPSEVSLNSTSTTTTTTLSAKAMKPKWVNPCGLRASPPKSKKNAHHSRFFDAVVAKPINEIYHDIILSAKNALKHSKHFKDEYVSF